MSNLKKGDIVTDLNEEHSFYERQGQVSRVYANGTVMVRFPKECVPDWCWRFNEVPHSVTFGYKADEAELLRKDEEWDRRNFPIVNHDNAQQVLSELLNLPFWPQDLTTGVVYAAQTDDTDGQPEYGWLEVQFSVDGDAHVHTSCEQGIPHEIRFRTYAGGGHNSQVIRNAILFLAVAMKINARRYSDGEES